MNANKKSLLSVLALIISVSAILAYLASGDAVQAKWSGRQGPVSVRAGLVQEKVLRGSDGNVVVSLTLAAAQIPTSDDRPAKQVDLVIVLDRSGSMQGQKIVDARNAVARLIDRLAPEDRLALVSYSNGVNTHFPLLAMNNENRQKAKTAVEQIHSGGGTNLGDGFDQGIKILMQTPGDGRQRKLVLISDGLANHGVTDPQALGTMAAGAVEHNFSVSTLGVGYDFNEVLMTTIADHGAGRYYFLENPNAFAKVFEKEFQSARNVAAASLKLRVPLKDGVQLIDAGGYPITAEAGGAVIHPGDLLSGQQRKLFLTFKVPTDRERNFALGPLRMQYQADGTAHAITSRSTLNLACVADKKAVMASIDDKAWEDKVVKDDYNRLKEAVATAIRKGSRDDAMVRIKAYETRNRAVNSKVGSAVVADNLDNDLEQLRQSVDETFVGAPAEVAKKKKQRAKVLQYESYQIRRDQK